MPADNPTDARRKAEARFDKAQRSTDTARALTDADLQAARNKTARLKALRQEKETAEIKTAISKAAAKKPKTSKRK
jgi:hypothetical protein